MAIDDLADRAHDCEVLLDQNLGRENGDYAALVPKGCGMLLGPAYALLRSQFGAAREGALERRVNWGEVSRIMVSMGATDPNGVTATVLDGIDRSGVAAAIDVVAPSDALRDVEKAALPLQADVHSDVADMAALMSRADLAIGGAGSTSWERCCLGLPSLLIVTADNQRAIADQLGKLRRGGAPGLARGRGAGTYRPGAGGHLGRWRWAAAHGRGGGAGLRRPGKPAYPGAPVMSDDWWARPRGVSVVVDNESWILSFAKDLVRALNAGGEPSGALPRPCSHRRGRGGFLSRLHPHGGTGGPDAQPPQPGGP